MADFFEDNKAFFLDEVAAFRPAALRKGVESTSTDTVISARIRPLLPHERDSGEVVGVTARPEDRGVDVHELRRKIKGATWTYGELNSISIFST